MEEAGKLIKDFKTFLGINPGFEKQGSRILYYVKESSEPLSIVPNKIPDYVITYDFKTKKETKYNFKSRGNPKYAKKD